MSVVRNPYFDIVRGVAIIMVIGIHTFSIASAASEIGCAVSVLIRQILNCAVPVFLAISGFFVASKAKVQYLSFLKKQIPSIYFPCLIWSIPFAVLAVYQGVTLGRVIGMTLICGMSIYYFVALIIQYYLLLPILCKMTNLKLIVCGFMSLISVACIPYLRLDSAPLVFYAGPFPVWILFFAIGIKASNIRDKMLSDDTPSKWYSSLFLPFSVIFIGLVLSCYETCLLVSCNGSGYGIKPSAFIYSIGVVSIIFYTKTEYFVLLNIRR